MGHNAVSIAELSTPWLLKDNNELYMQNFGDALDTLVDKVKQGVEARLPGVGTLSALPYIGLDRVMPKAPTESDASYIIRLREAYNTWQRAGNRPTVLRQVDTYVGTRILRPINQTPMVLTVGNSDGETLASWDWYYSTNSLAAAPQRALIAPTNWNWDDAFSWWRTWLVIFAIPGSVLEPEGVWGVGEWDEPGGSWGLNIGPEFATGLRDVVRLWKSANTFYPWFVISFNPGNGSSGSAFSPNSAQGDGNPDGNWGSWGTIVDTVYVSSRPDDARFLDGS